MNIVPGDKTMPTLFVSHGSPMLAMDAGRGQQYKQWGQSLPKPKAILVFSAHWQSKQLSFGEDREHNTLVYDFYGFPEPLYRLQYTAPGSQWLVERVQNLLHDQTIGLDTKRGLDHGVWVPFLHLWPEADVPVMQMSMPDDVSNRELFGLGKRLAPLRDQGVLIVGSGMITHNLGEWNPRYRGEPMAWAKSFDDWVTSTLVGRDVTRLLGWETTAPNALRNHPTPEHFRPLLIAAGAAGWQSVSFPIEGFDAGMLSNRSVQFDG